MKLFIHALTSTTVWLNPRADLEGGAPFYLDVIFFPCLNYTLLVKETPGLQSKAFVKCMWLINNNFKTWLLIGWRLCCHFLIFCSQLLSLTKKVYVDLVPLDVENYLSNITIIVNSLLCNYIGKVADHHWEKIAINNAIAFHCVTAVIDFPIADITQTIFNHYANGQRYPKMPIVALCWDISRHSDGAQWCISAP